ncbi:uncharacterized protein RJT20DRAFT_128674 [Scheffersomyces xylosifermentans]|uniref:uncharacterized protein n=1 Tax=Scheffersomyces xylosifermentans TaxID=1304137 RepID=UPI00315CEE34
MVVSLNFRRKLEEYKSVVYKSKEEILRRNINLYLSNQTVPHWMTREYGDLSKTRYLPLAQCKKLQKYAKKKHDIDSNIQEKSCGSNSKFKTELGQHRLMKSSKKSKMTHSNIEALRKQKDWMSDTYYSRLNINDLSKILGLDDYHISLTKEIEINILEIFRSVSDFKIGYQTWVRDTPKEKRKDLIENLYSYTCFFYPEIDTFKLEIIVRRGCYSLMQSRLRRERRQSTISSGTSKKR